MNNDEYYRQMREQQRKEDDARLRRNLEDMARSQREQQARNLENLTKSTSRNLGRIGAIPSPFGGAVDMSEYNRGQAESKALQAMLSVGRPTQNNSGGVTYSRRQGSARKSGAGGFVLLLLIGGAVWLYFNGADNHGSPKAKETPVESVASDPSNSATRTGEVTSPPDSAIRSNPYVPPAETTSPPRVDEAPPSESEEISNPAPVIAPWPAAGKLYVAKHKGHGGCKGNLLLLPDRLEFSCIENPEKRFSETVVGMRVDDDGVALSSDKKYHFAIENGNKEQTREIFQDWLARAQAYQGNSAP